MANIAQLVKELIEGGSISQRVTEAKKRTTFDPVSKKKVPVKSIKTKAGGPVTRGGKPVPDEELKPKDRFKKKKQEESTNPADIRRLVSRLLSEDCGNVCHQCGKDYRTDENGVNTHCGPDGEGDFDADLDHVPYGEPGEGDDFTDYGDSEFSDEELRDASHAPQGGDTGSKYVGRSFYANNPLPKAPAPRNWRDYPHR